ncbi:MAG: HAD-IA family hydrolase [Actinomycetota bacterium]
MPNAAVTTVFWDFGGVLTTSPFEAFNRYEAEAGLPRDLIRTLNATNPDANAWARLERSDITVDEFSEVFEAEALAAGHRIDGNEVLACLSGDLRPGMVEALRRCAKHLRCVCVTNNIRTGEGPGMATDAGRAAAIDQVMELFDVIVESSVVGVRKPELRFYEVALAQAGAEPTEVVYLDDLGVNLKPARALGMQTIKVVDPDVALMQLGEATGLDLPTRAS